jgi:hypothetical protein
LSSCDNSHDGDSSSVYDDSDDDNNGCTSSSSSLSSLSNDRPFLRLEHVTFRDIDTTTATDKCCHFTDTLPYFFRDSDRLVPPEMQRTRDVTQEGYCKYLRQLNYVVRHPTFVACLGNERRIAELRQRLRALKANGKYAAAFNYVKDKYVQVHHTVRTATSPCRIFWNETATTKLVGPRCRRDEETMQRKSIASEKEVVASPTVVSEIVGVLCKEARKQQTLATTLDQPDLNYDAYVQSTLAHKLILKRSNNIVKRSKNEWAATLKTVVSPDLTTEMGRPFSVSDAGPKYTLEVCCPEYFAAGLWETIKSVVSNKSSDAGGSGDGKRGKTLETTIQRTDRMGRLRDGSSTDENNWLLLATQRHNKNRAAAPLLYKLTEDEDGQPCVTELEVIIDNGEVQTHLVNARLLPDALPSSSSSSPSSWFSGSISTSSLISAPKSSINLDPHLISKLIVVPDSAYISSLTSSSLTPIDVSSYPTLSSQYPTTLVPLASISSAASTATSSALVSPAASWLGHELTEDAKRHCAIDIEATSPLLEESKEEKKTLSSLFKSEPLPLVSPPSQQARVSTKASSPSQQVHVYTKAALDWRQKKCRVDRVRVKSIRRARVDNGRVVYLDEYLRGPCMMCEEPRTTMTSCCRLMLCKTCADEYVKVRTTCCVCAQPIDSFFTVDVAFVWRPPKVIAETDTMSRWDADRRYSLRKSWSTIAVAERGEHHCYIKDAISEAKLDPNAKPCSDGLHCVTRVDDLVPWFEHFDIPDWARPKRPNPPSESRPPKPTVPPHADAVPIDQSSHTSTFFPSSSSSSTSSSVAFSSARSHTRPYFPTFAPLSVEMTMLSAPLSVETTTLTSISTSSSLSPSSLSSTIVVPARPRPSAPPLYLMQPPSPHIIVTLPLVHARPIPAFQFVDSIVSSLPTKETLQAASDTFDRAPSLNPSPSLDTSPSSNPGVKAVASSVYSAPPAKWERKKGTEVYGHGVPHSNAAYMPNTDRSLIASGTPVSSLPMRIASPPTPADPPRPDNLPRSFLLPENTFVSPENTFVSPENTFVSPENTFVSPENTFVSPLGVTIQLPKNFVSIASAAVVAPIYPEVVAPNRYAPYQSLFGDDGVYGTFQPTLSAARTTSTTMSTSLVVMTSNDTGIKVDVSESQPLVVPIPSIMAPSVKPTKSVKSRIVMQL